MPYSSPYHYVGRYTADFGPHIVATEERVTYRFGLYMSYRQAGYKCNTSI